MVRQIKRPASIAVAFGQPDAVRCAASDRKACDLEDGAACLALESLK